MTGSRRRTSGRKRARVRSRSRDGGGTDRPVRGEHPLVRLQRAHGNQAVQRTVRDRRRSVHGVEVGDPDDKYEREADRVARKVVDTPDRQTPRRDTSATTPRPAASPSGRPLAEGTLESMESRFDRDFSAVRVHSGGEAADLSQRLNARAFTVGSDVYFDRGEYRPTTAGGERLLAHELAHVVQQRGAEAAHRGDARAWGSNAEATEATTDAGVRVSNDVGHTGPTVQRQTNPPVRQGPPPLRPGQPVTGECTLPTGVFRWSIVPGTKPEGVEFVDRDGVRRVMSAGGCFNVQIVFYPGHLRRFLGGGWLSPSVGAAWEADRTRIAFVQTVEYESEGLGDRPQTVDQFGGRTTPFYGARFDPEGEMWADEPRAGQGDCPGLPRADAGSQHGPGSHFSRRRSYGAVVNDSPSLNGGERKLFETVAVAMETGQRLGSLRWVIEHDGDEAVVDSVSCHEESSRGFETTVENFFSGGDRSVVDGFAVGEASLPAGAPTVLDSVVERFASEHPPQQVVLSGAATAGEQEPTSLARARAERVAEYLTSRGVDRTAIVIESFGASFAREPIDTENAGERNRRVQVTLRY